MGEMVGVRIQGQREDVFALIVCSELIKELNELSPG